MLNVSKSGYYNYLKASISSRKIENLRLLEKIKNIHLEARAIYGSPRMHKELEKMGESCSRKCVSKLMKENKIRAKTNRKQILSYLKLSDCKYGLLINFNVKLLRDGIRRFKV